MKGIPIQTRQKILRKSRLLIASGECMFICEAIVRSYPGYFQKNFIGYTQIPALFPEVLKRKPKNALESWFDNEERHLRINLLTDAINELNGKIKEQAGMPTNGLGADGRRIASRVHARRN